MSMKYFAVDPDEALAESESAVWVEARGIGMERVDTMTEAIQKLLIGKYLYVGINGDAVDFMPLLRTMRSVTNTPILIATNNFTTEKEVAALGSGVDLYARFHKDGEGNMRTEGNIASVLAWVENITNRDKEVKPPPRVIVCGNMLVLADNKMVYCKDAEIAFTPKEYGILLHMLEHRNINITNQQLAGEVWGDDAVSDETIRKNIDRLRSKLADIDFRGAEIVSFRGMGYRFNTQSEI